MLEEGCEHLPFGAEIRAADSLLLGEPLINGRGANNWIKCSSYSPPVALNIKGLASGRGLSAGGNVLPLLIWPSRALSANSLRAGGVHL